MSPNMRAGAIDVHAHYNGGLTEILTRRTVRPFIADDVSGRPVLHAMTADTALAPSYTDIPTRRACSDRVQQTRLSGNASQEQRDVQDDVLARHGQGRVRATGHLIDSGRTARPVASSFPKTIAASTAANAAPDDGTTAEIMMTTSGCRAQSTTWRMRFLAGVIRGFSALAFAFVALPVEGRTEPLVKWTSEIPRLPPAIMNGQPLALDDLRGRTVLVHFFATWCEPCGPELQALNRLQAEFGEALSIIAIDVGEPQDRLQRYLDKFPARYPVARDEDRLVSRAWGVYALPTTFVIDRTLAPVWQAHGDVDWDHPEIREQLKDTFKSPAETAGP